MASTQSSQTLCDFCRLPQAQYACGPCSASLCRKCAVTLEGSTFEFTEELPEELSHSIYCAACYDNIVEPAKEDYEKTLAEAKEMPFWPKTYRGSIPVVRKGQTELRVEQARDRSEVLLKLAFKAVRQGFSGLMYGELVGKKVRNEGYQKTEWRGNALPVHIDRTRLREDE
ncbi:MAG: hypothetical protein AB1540_10630 [Bdellovibrionota bacterium]